MTMIAESPFPPVFHNDPWSYGFGLFGDLAMSMLSLTLLLAHVFERRRNARVRRIIKAPAQHPDNRAWSPLFLYRCIVISFLTILVLRATPDALWMLLYGEVSHSTSRALIQIDLWLDFVAILPLGFAVLCWCWGRQVIPQMLLTNLKEGITGGPSWDVLWKNGRIVLVLLLIAIGVTVGKAVAQ